MTYSIKVHFEGYHRGLSNVGSTKMGVEKISGDDISREENSSSALHILRVVGRARTDPLTKKEHRPAKAQQTGCSERYSSGQLDLVQVVLFGTEKLLTMQENFAGHRASALNLFLRFFSPHCVGQSLQRGAHTLSQVLITRLAAGRFSTTGDTRYLVGLLSQ